MRKPSYIISVTFVPANHVIEYWRGFLQRIETDIGVFFDNNIQTNYNNHYYTAGSQEPGYPWKEGIVDPFSIEVIKAKGFNWLKHI